MRELVADILLGTCLAMASPCITATMYGSLLLLPSLWHCTVVHCPKCDSSECNFRLKIINVSSSHEAWEVSYLHHHNLTLLLSNLDINYVCLSYLSKAVDFVLPKVAIFLAGHTVCEACVYLEGIVVTVVVCPLKWTAAHPKTSKLVRWSFVLLRVTLR